MIGPSGSFKVGAVQLLSAPPETLDPRALAETYHAVRAATEAFSAHMEPEDQVVQSMSDVSPAKWHRAHTTWFFETFVLRRADPGYDPVHPAYALLFNSYYQAVGPQFPRPRRGLLSRPTVTEVGAYRARVDARIARLLQAAPAPELLALVQLGLHHEQQHQELMRTDILHVLAQNPLEPALLPPAPPAPGPGGAPGWHGFEGGRTEIGHAGPGFHFDNEGPRHAVLLHPFTLRDRPISNGEVAAFIADRGYARPELWLSLGFDAVRAGGWEMPLYWRREGDGCYSAMSLHGRQALDPAAPAAHLCYFEAEAVARWLGARLPTEAEWEHARVSEPSFGTQHGEVWEWTRSAYSPYPGYRTPAGAVGEYNGKFMCNQQVLRGGSRFTPEGHVRPTYRNFFPPGARWQRAGARIARDGA